MFKFIRIGFSSVQQEPDPTQPRLAWGNEDRSWHHSSFELARGLEVIEHCGRPPAILAEPSTAFDPRRA
jgi:hypothetical protein